MKELIKYIEESNLGEYKENVSFSTITTYRCGGIAKLVFFPSSIDNLIEFLKKIKTMNIPFKVFGNGSNILASDEIYDGVIIKLTKLNNYSLDYDTNILSADAGCNMMNIANSISKEGYTGLEFACGIPGSVGGCVYMNAGAYLKDISTILLEATLLDSNYNIVVKKNSQLDFSYRKSMLQGSDYICLKAKFKLEKGDKEQIKEVLKDRLNRRLTSQPLEYPSAGSVFRNPTNDYAGRLIEECNLKGYTHNGAEISSKHANFIINKNNATASDIKYLMELAKIKVKEKFDVELFCEQELFNFK